MTSNHDQPTQTFASIGIDIGKDVFHIVGFDTSGKVVLRKKFKRLALEYVAKFSLAPASPNLASLTGVEIDLSGRENGIRKAIADVVRTEPTVWDFKVQLLTNLGLMPIEDSAVVWPETESAFQTVATLTVSPQSSWSEDRSRIVDDGMAFSVWHGLADHQPLGSINRVRRGSYAMSSAHRARVNGCPILEPAAPVDLPSG